MLLVLVKVLVNLCFPVVKYSQQMLCDSVNLARLSGGDRTGCLVVSPVQLEPSHTLLENPKQVRTLQVKPGIWPFTPKCPFLLSKVA